MASNLVAMASWIGFEGSFPNLLSSLHSLMLSIKRDTQGVHMLDSHMLRPSCRLGHTVRDPIERFQCAQCS